MLIRPHRTLSVGRLLPFDQHASIMSLNGVDSENGRVRSSSGSVTMLNSGLTVYAAAPSWPVACVLTPKQWPSSLPFPLPM